MINQPAHLLRAYDGQGWRAMFCPGGFQHSLASHAGTVGPSPWEAAADALNRLQAGEPVTPDWTMTDESPA